MKRRVKFCKRYEDWTSRQWVSYLDGVADFKEFTWYPSDLRPRFNEVRARWLVSLIMSVLVPVFVFVFVVVLVLVLVPVRVLVFVFLVFLVFVYQAKQKGP